MTAAGPVLGPGEGGRHFRARGSEMWFKAIGETTGGDLSCMERTLPPGGRQPPAHRHTNCSEAYFVLEGTVSVLLEGEELSLEPEQFLLVRRGRSHTFGSGSPEPARLLVIHAPAMDGYFAALHELWHQERPPSPEDERALMARFGMEPG